MMSERPTPAGWDIRHYRLRESDVNRLRRELGLSLRAYAVLDALVAHDLPQRAEGGSYRKGVVWPSVGRVAALCACSERTVQRGLAELIGLGLVRRIVCGRGRAAQIVIAWHKLCSGAPGGKGDSHAVTRPTHRSRSGVEEKETARAAACSPAGPPPRRGFWEEELPPMEKRREIVALVRHVLTGEDAIGRRTPHPTH